MTSYLFGRKTKPLNCSEGKTCKSECSKMEIHSRRIKQENEDLLPRHSFMDIRVNSELLAKNEALPQSLSSGIAGPETLLLLSLETAAAFPM